MIPVFPWKGKKKGPHCGPFAYQKNLPAPFVPRNPASAVTARPSAARERPVSLLRAGEELLEPKRQRRLQLQGLFAPGVGKAKHMGVKGQAPHRIALGTVLPVPCHRAS